MSFHVEVPLVAVFLVLAAGCSSKSADQPTPGVDSGSTDVGVDAGGDGAVDLPASVLQHHNGPSRAGLYVDATLTREVARLAHLDTSFNAPISGPTYGQPLFLATQGGKDLVFIATEQNEVTAFDASTAAIVWRVSLGTPVKHATLPSGCGDIDPLGVTSTGILDPSSRTLYLAAMTTDDDSVTKKHRIFALSVDDGSVKPGWPVDVSATIDTPIKFDSSLQHQRGALMLMGGVLYVPYGGHFECGGHHGWVIGVPTASPKSAKGWATRSVEGGVWAPGGISSDGTSLFVTTGQSSALTGSWADAKGLLRLSPGPTFSGSPTDYWAPDDWNSESQDVGSSVPLPVDVAGATPSKLLLSFTRGDGYVHLLDRGNLGGVGAEIVKTQVATSDVVTSPITYTTPQGTYVVFNGFGRGCPGKAGNLTAIRLSAASPPKVTVAWCATTNGNGIPMVTSTDGSAQTVVWAVGTEGLNPKGTGTLPGDNRLHGFDGDTGEVIFDGGGDGDVMTSTRRYITPIAARGRIFVAANDQLFSFATK